MVAGSTRSSLLLRCSSFRASKSPQRVWGKISTNMMCVCVYKHMCTCVYIYISCQRYIYIYVYYTYTYTCTGTYTSTYTRTARWKLRELKKKKKKKKKKNAVESFMPQSSQVPCALSPEWRLVSRVSQAVFPSPQLVTDACVRAFAAKKCLV